jgi:small-conductance mechanosensitive channel
MGIVTFIQDSLIIVWVVLALATAILILGWVLGRMLSRTFIRLLGTTNITKVVSKWLKQRDTTRLDTWTRRVIRWGVLLLALWFAGDLLCSHPDIGRFLGQAWTAIGNSTHLLVVVLIFRLALIAVATFLLFKSFGWVKGWFANFSKRIAAERGKRLTGVKIQTLQLISAKQMTDFLLAVSKYSRYAVNIVLILIYLSGVFSIFPQTRGVVNGLLGSIFQVITRGWNSFVEYLPSLIDLIIIIVVTRYGLKFIRFVFREIGKQTITFPGFQPEWARPTYQLVRFGVLALALVIAFPFLPGSASPAFKGISIFIAVLLSLGSTSLVGNIVAGISLTYTRAFRIGDRVQIADTIGDVIDKGLFVTHVRTIKNVEITIPNGMVLGSHIINYSQQAKERGLILHTTVTIGYATPWRLIHEALIKAALATADILAEPRPFVLQTSLNDFYVSYELNAYTKQPLKMAVIYSELHQNIQDQCKEAGIEIMSPHYRAIRDGNRSTIPTDNLPKDYGK